MESGLHGSPTRPPAITALAYGSLHVNGRQSGGCGDEQKNTGSLEALSWVER